MLILGVYQQTACSDPSPLKLKGDKFHPHVQFLISFLDPHFLRITLSEEKRQTKPEKNQLQDYTEKENIFKTSVWPEKQDSATLKKEQHALKRSIQRTEQLLRSLIAHDSRNTGEKSIEVLEDKVEEIFQK